MDGYNSRPGFAASIIISALFLGIVVLFAAWGGSRAVEYLAGEGLPSWIGLFVNYCIMLAVTLVLVIASSMGDPTGFGFTRAKVAGGYGAGITWGMVLGILASFAALASGTGGPSPLKDLNFIQVVLLVWFFASIAEEVLVRGYVQSYLEPLKDRYFQAFRMRVSLPVIISALFFAAMHLILLSTGTPLLATYIIVAFAFFLGLVAAYQRERTSSLLPAFAAHISFNIGGVVGGAIYVILQIAVFGKTVAEVTRALSG
jgi:membrane protease YdiL (CAAX protease family)